jgi:Yos1-like
LLLAQVFLLFLNAIAILNRKRFLSKFGLDDVTLANDETSAKGKFVRAYQAASFGNVFIAFFNIAAIVGEILMGS